MCAASCPDDLGISNMHRMKGNYMLASHFTCDAECAEAQCADGVPGAKGKGQNGSAPTSPPQLAATQAAAPASGGKGKQISEEQRRRGPSADGKRGGKPPSDAQVSALQRHIKVLEAEKATLLGELQRQREVQSQHAQVQPSLASILILD